MKVKFFCCGILVSLLSTLQGKELDFENHRQLDEGYINEIERGYPPKVLHAEPLFIDLIRDLGARKGEAEWNLGFGLQDKRNYVEYHALVEYEWAPIDRLGLEIEFPFYFFNPYQKFSEEFVENTPAHRLDSLKLASQYTFFVSTSLSTSLALGYIQEFLLPYFNSQTVAIRGFVYNPFFIAAKRWGNNFHSLIYTGPFFEKLNNAKIHAEYHFHLNLHWMLLGTRNFIGLETNFIFYSKNLDVTFRPQMRLSITDNFLIGIVSVLPSDLLSQGMGFFVRAIYEPGHEH